MENENGYKKLWIKDDIYTLVDSSLYPFFKQWKWNLNKGQKYPIRFIKAPYSKGVFLHKTLALIKYGEIKKGFVVDHIDRNPLNNTMANIRLTSHCFNSHNARKQSNTSSKYIGINYMKDRRKWMAKLMFKKKAYYVGMFSNEKEAAIARDKKAVELYGRYARLNFPELFEFK